MLMLKYNHQKTKREVLLHLFFIIIIILNRLCGFNLKLKPQTLEQLTE